MTDEVCPVCLQRPAEVRDDSAPGTSRVICSTCGDYRISGSAWASADALTDGGRERFLLAAAVREQSDHGTTPVLTADTIPALIASVQRPKNPLAAIDRLLLWIHDHMVSAANYVSINPGRDYSIAVGRDSAEFAYYLQKAKELSWIERPSGEKLRLDLKGWERVADLRRTQVISDRAFVAMSFHKSLDAAWKEGIAPALDELDYHPIRVDQVQHNDKIDDVIIAEIRRSGLMVADFTGHRAGVYFEAGFAMGLGVPVVRTCHESDIKKTHFDTRQYNHVVWSDPGDLKERLRARIEATITSRPSARNGGTSQRPYGA